MKDAIFQTRMDSNLKREVEELYKGMGMSFAEAVRILAQQSLIQETMPIVLKAPKKKTKRSGYGIAKGKFVIPDDIDFCNDEISDLFYGDDSEK